MADRSASPRHLLSVTEVSRPWLDALCDRAAAIPREPAHAPLAGRILATLFYEPSTRTRLSFEAAMLRLGGGVISTENAREFSSAAKGENIEDTTRIVEGYADIIAVRYHERGGAERAAAVAQVPIINAGDGPGEHPTQALLDWFTLVREFGAVDGLRIALVGDLAYGRAVRSLAMLLALARGVSLVFIAPPVTPMGADVKAYLDARQVRWEETTDLRGALAQVDAVYMTRVQKERFGADLDAYQAARIYAFTPEMLPALPAHARILHR
ncbi:MAG: aspartate carbamoyltransferase [Thermomicrobia bacterium]|nr:aspartate carbamoyltransferase [Thermomicrobia bacterium]